MHEFDAFSETWFFWSIIAEVYLKGLALAHKLAWVSKLHMLSLRAVWIPMSDVWSYYCMIPLVLTVNSKSIENPFCHFISGHYMIITNASIFLCGLACLPWKSTCITWYSHCIYWSCVTNDAGVRIFSLCAATAFRKGRCCFWSECFSGCFSPPLGIARILCLMLRPLRLGLALYAVSPSRTYLFGKSLYFCACCWCGQGVGDLCVIMVSGNKTTEPGMWLCWASLEKPLMGTVFHPHS